MVQGICARHSTWRQEPGRYRCLALGPFSRNANLYEPHWNSINNTNDVAQGRISAPWYLTICSFGCAEQRAAPSRRSRSTGTSVSPPSADHRSISKLYVAQDDGMPIRSACYALKLRTDCVIVPRQIRHEASLDR